MRLAKIESNIVKNIIVGKLDDFPDHVEVTGVEVGIGWADNNDGTFTRPIDPVQPALVGMGALGELLPTAVRAELRGYALDSGIGQGKRKASGQIINRIHSNGPVDANGSELATLLSQLVIHTALTQPESDAILAALQA